MDSKSPRDQVRSSHVLTRDNAEFRNEHSVHMTKREQVVIHGVIAIDSFADQTIVLETNMGILTIKGENLHIKQLDLESGKFLAEGTIVACVYTTPIHRGSKSIKNRGFLSRLLR